MSHHAKKGSHLSKSPGSAPGSHNVSIASRVAPSSHHSAAPQHKSVVKPKTGSAMAKSGRPSSSHASTASPTSKSLVKTKTGSTMGKAGPSSPSHKSAISPGSKSGMVKGSKSSPTSHPQSAVSHRKKTGSSVAKHGKQAKSPSSSMVKHGKQTKSVHHPGSSMAKHGKETKSRPHSPKGGRSRVPKKYSGWVPQKQQSRPKLPPRKITCCHRIVQRFFIAKPKPDSQFEETHKRWYLLCNTHIVVVVFVSLIFMALFAFGFLTIGLGTTFFNFNFPFKLVATFFITLTMIVGFRTFCNPRPSLLSAFKVLTILSLIATFLTATACLILYISATEEALWIREYPFDTNSYDGLNILLDSILCYMVFFYFVFVLMSLQLYRVYYAKKFEDAPMTANTAWDSSSKQKSAKPDSFKYCAIQ